MTKITHKIFFDTNIVHLDKDEEILDKLFAGSLLELKKFVKEKLLRSVEVCLPEQVVQERLSQKIRKIRSIQKNLNNYKAEFKKIGIDINTDKCDEANYLDIYNQIITKFLEENGIEVIKTPKIEMNILQDRIFNYKPPFSFPDRGLKDTLIWLTILEDAAVNNETDYVLITKDTQFDPSEFKDYSKRKIHIFDNLLDVKNLLDKELNLQLQLKDLYDEVINEIAAKKSGDIILKLNQYRPYKSAYAMVSTFGGFNKDEKVLAYNANSIAFTNIDKIGGNIFKVRAILDVTPRYIDEIKEDSSPSDTFAVTSVTGISSALSFYEPMPRRKRRMSLEGEITYDRSSGEIKLDYVSEIPSADSWLMNG